LAHDAHADLLEGSPYVSYSYAYPHKTAYHDLDPPIALGNLWQAEDRSALSLYVHVPFCEFRCGFCNLFTVSQPHEEMVAGYLAALRRQAATVRASLEDAQFARLALGGGTPTFLDMAELESVFDVVTNVMGADTTRIPFGIEVSPATVSCEKMQLLGQFGVDRVSIGVQSFIDADTHAIGRPQHRDDVERSLAIIRDAAIPTLNIDLIYGGERQTIESWLATVEETLEWQPEEIYLYPLYVRPLTGLGMRDRAWDDLRLESYREARDLLLDRGYQQISMRMFRAEHAPKESGPAYCCQEDGMIGLGAGARSYTTALHYSDHYAVQQRAVAAVVRDYVERDEAQFGVADYGFQLDDEDQRRRFAIISLLQSEGLSRHDYHVRFGGDVCDDLPEFLVLEKLELATFCAERVQLTAAGLQRSDAIGPWLYSDKVRHRMEQYEWA
ncbi:MAG: STM4012 family radical SAM protein, partial [Pirellulales bacterium]|nr:STM4012 family radical SAM protein [Pirellulales bacterium]